MSMCVYLGRASSLNLVLLLAAAHQLSELCQLHCSYTSRHKQNVAAICSPCW